MLTDSSDAPLILLVEDDENHAELMKLSLMDSADEYRLEIAGSLHGARSFIEHHPPDIVLTDFRLPDGEGSMVVEIVSGHCPVVLLTSHGSEQVAVDAMKAGLHDYVVKSPEVFSGLPRIIHRVLREWSLIQERKRAEEERQRMERHLLHIQKLESLVTMSGGIAHDFNNLLQAVLGNLEMALRDIPASTAAGMFITHAVSAVGRAASLSGMMLAYSGKGFLKIRELNLAELVESVAAEFKTSISGNIVLEVIPEPSLPPVMADEDQLRQVVMNLAINAAEAIGDRNGLIVMSAGADNFDQKRLNCSRIEEKLAAGRYVWLEVRDSGCGMDAATRDKLFDPFFTTKFTGRGLGMSAVHGIIRAHKGAILVDSSPGQGTTVRILLPFVPDP